MFWSPAALAGLLAVITPDQSGLKMDNLRLTYGSPGPDRASAQVFPGDEVFLAFELKGFKSSEGGVTKIKLTTEVMGKDGKTEYKQDTGDSQVLDLFGGGRHFLHTRVDVGVKTPPGSYKVKITALDLTTKESISGEKDVTLLEPALAVVKTALFTDQAMRATSQVLGVGQPVFVGFSVVGFARESSTNHPKLKMELVVKDDKGAVVTDKPSFVVDANQPEKMPANVQVMPGHFKLPLNKAGNFTVELRATDLTNQKSSQPVVLRLVVTEAK